MNPEPANWVVVTDIACYGIFPDGDAARRWLADARLKRSPQVEGRVAKPLPILAANPLMTPIADLGPES